MMKTKGRVIRVIRENTNDFSFDIQWDMSFIERQATPRELLDKFPPVNERDTADLQVILERVINKPINAPTDQMCAWLERVLVAYFDKGPIGAQLEISRGPKSPEVLSRYQLGEVDDRDEPF